MRHITVFLILFLISFSLYGKKTQVERPGWSHTIFHGEAEGPPLVDPDHEVSVASGILTVSGQKTMSNEDRRGSEQSVSSFSSSLSQSFDIPNFVDSENGKISNNDKKIILTFPKENQEA